MSSLEKAIALAVYKHNGEVDQAGQTYILHPLRVMFSLGDVPEFVKICAVLHDIIEDTDVTIESLLEIGFSSQVGDILTTLTRPKNMSYEKYIDRICTNYYCVLIKLADMKDNMDVNRLVDFTEKDIKRLTKYHTNYKKLIKARDSLICSVLM